jgi:hypothetical protein
MPLPHVQTVATVCPPRPLPIIKRGSPMYVAPACAGSGKGSNHFESYVRSIYLHFSKRLFPGLEPMTLWSQVNSFTAAPRLSFKKVSPVHVAPVCVGSKKGSGHFKSYVHSFSLHFCKRLFSGLEPMT